MNNPIGIIAGGGQFPGLFARAARKTGRSVVIIAHEGESDPDLENETDRFYWIKLGQLGKIIKYFKKENVTETVFLGSIKKTRIFRDARPDLRALSLWNKMHVRHDDSLLKAFAADLEKEGILVVPSTLYLQHLLFPEGYLTKKRPNENQLEDIRFAWRIAREIGRLDIGQSIVVRDKVVMAVEAIEGTDAAILRGGALCAGRAVIVKVKKPIQDFRFDLPAIGVTTVDNMREVKAAVLAVEAGQALLFDQEQVIGNANKAGIIILGIRERCDGIFSFDRSRGKHEDKACQYG